MQQNDSSLERLHGSQDLGLISFNTLNHQSDGASVKGVSEGMSEMEGAALCFVGRVVVCTQGP